MGYNLKDYYQGTGTYVGVAYRLAFIDSFAFMRVFNTDNSAKNACDKAESNELILFGNLDAEL